MQGSVDFSRVASHITNGGYFKVCHPEGVAGMKVEGSNSENNQSSKTGGRAFQPSMDGSLGKGQDFQSRGSRDTWILWCASTLWLLGRLTVA